MTMASKVTPKKGSAKAAVATTDPGLLARLDVPSATVRFDLANDDLDL
jgi:hypothetical protein